MSYPIASMRKTGMPGERPAWHELAACRGATVSFFPERGQNNDGSWRRAMETCAGCPVRELCLEQALANNEQHGIWGGTSERQRRRIRRERERVLARKMEEGV